MCSGLWLVCGMFSRLLMIFIGMVEVKFLIRLLFFWVLMVLSRLFIKVIRLDFMLVMVWWVRVFMMSLCMWVCSGGLLNIRLVVWCLYSVEFVLYLGVNFMCLLELKVVVLWYIVIRLV